MPFIGAVEPNVLRVEDAAVMQFETEGGAMGTTVISQISAGRKDRLWLEVDARGSLPAPRPMRCP